MSQRCVSASAGVWTWVLWQDSPALYQTSKRVNPLARVNRNITHSTTYSQAWLNLLNTSGHFIILYILIGMGFFLCCVILHPVHFDSKLLSFCMSDYEGITVHRSLCDLTDALVHSTGIQIKCTQWSGFRRFQIRQVALYIVSLFYKEQMLISKGGVGGGCSLGLFCCTFSMFVVSVNIVKLNVHYYENVCLFCCQNWHKKKSQKFQMGRRCLLSVSSLLNLWGVLPWWFTLGFHIPGSKSLHV